MNIECRFGKALKWKEETQGKIERRTDRANLFMSDTDQSWRFQDNKKIYNACFHIISFDADKYVTISGFSPIFTVQGKICQWIGCSLPAQNQEQIFLQIYFIGDKVKQTNKHSQVVQKSKEK